MRLIDADELIKEFLSVCRTEFEVKNKCMTDENVLFIIQNAPTVDTTCPNCDSGYAQGYSDGYLKGKEERPQGEWITFPNRLIIQCSQCTTLLTRQYIFKDSIGEMNFCPNCGADMRGGRE